MNIKKQISEERIACVIPTYNRAYAVYKNLMKFCESVSVKTDFFIIDDSKEEHERISESCVKAIVDGSCHRLRQLVIHKMNKGWGTSLNEGVTNALDGRYQFVLCLDDDCTVLKNCVERYLALAIQDRRYAHISTHDNYRRFWRDWWRPNLVQFYLALGVAILQSRVFLEKAGNWDPNLTYHNEGDMALKAWKNGFYSAAVFGPIRHKRSGENFKIGDTEKAVRNGKVLEKRYPDMMKVSSRGYLLRRFEFPPQPWNLNLETLKLEKRRHIRHEDS